MSTKSFNQLGKLVVADAAAVAAAANVAALATGEVQAFAQDATTAATGKPFIVYQKTANGIEKSGAINPAKVKRVASYDTVAKVQKAIEVGTIASITEGETYGIQVRVYNYGSLSPENFYTFDAYDVAIAGDTQQALLGRIRALFVIQQDAEQKSLFTFGAVAGTGASAKFAITAIEQAHNAATKPSEAIQFDAIIKEGDSGVGVVTVTQAYVKGIGDGKDMADIEYNLTFNDAENYAGNAFPNLYNSPYYIDTAKTYDVIHITYAGGRGDHVIENQYVELIIAADSTLTVANVNTQIVDELNKFLPADKQVADLT